ncbi:MAG: hypothetical protein ABI843_00430 [Dokdonella sp.]
MASALYPAVVVQRPLRVGLLLDSLHVPAWVERSIGLALEAGDAPIVSVLLNASDASASAAIAARSHRPTLFEQYVARDVARYRRPQSALALRDVSTLLQSIAILNILPHDTAAGSEYGAADVGAVRALELDAIVDFGARTIGGDMLGAARCGLWSHLCGDIPHRRGDADFFREILTRDPRSVTGLYAADAAADRAKILLRSVAATNFLSLELSRNHTLWKSASFLSRQLRRAARSTESVPDDPADGVRIEPSEALPGNTEMLAFFARTALRRFQSGVRRRGYDEHWILGYRYAATPLQPDAPVMESVHALLPPRGHFHADPCVISRDDRDFLFYEDFDYATELGSIACVELTEQGPVGAARLVLQTGSHLSYPHVFEVDRTMYMVPESGAARRVSLYRASEFPWRWEPVADLLEGHNAVDATLWQHQGHWYLFTAIAESGGVIHDELFLFHSNSLLGPWLPHPCNPVVSDVGRARPAGALFLRDGRLIRPAQDCAVNYGRAVVFNEVIELSPQRYRERALGRLDAAWYPGLHGCHTYNASGRIEVVDGKFHARKNAVRCGRDRQP